MTLFYIKLIQDLLGASRIIIRLKPNWGVHSWGSIEPHLTELKHVHLKYFTLKKKWLIN